MYMYTVCLKSISEQRLLSNLILSCTMTSLKRPIRLLKTRLINAIQTVRVFRRLINIFAGLINIFAGVIIFLV